MNWAAGIYFFLTNTQSIFGLILDSAYALVFPLLAFFSWHTCLYRALNGQSSSMWYFGYFAAA